jgi:ABC-2 type transport system permease protein
MNKYLEFFNMEVKDSISERARFLVWTISKPLLMLINILIWTSIFSNSGQETIGGFNMEQAINYFIFQNALSGIIYSGISRAMGDRIEDGLLSVHLLKPMNLSIAWAFRGLGGRFFALFYESIPSIAFAMIFFGFKIYSLPMFLISIISLFLGYFINYFFSIIWSLAYFKMINFWPFERIKGFITNFFMGVMIPINFMPLALQNILKFLPFSYMSFEASKIYLGIYDYPQIAQILGIQILWIIGLFILFNFLFKIAIRVFEGVGA